MNDYLLDTNIIAYWFDETRAEHERVVRRIGDLSEDDHLWVSVITLGEIEYGLKCGQDPSPDAVREYLDLVEERLPIIAGVSKHTAAHYGDLRAKLFQRFAPRTRRRRWVEELVDPATGKELGIQENDVWIAAQALERNLVLVTNDRMARIREVAPELRVENWAEAET